jgi:CRP/FNR family transcriptional regulator, cyclic AMP receptor protein
LREAAAPCERGAVASVRPGSASEDSWRSVIQLDARLRERATALPGEIAGLLRVEVVEFDTGPADLAAVAEEPEGWLGLLILEGLFLVTLEAGHGRVGWLIGTDDFIRPWDMPELCLTSDTSCHALKPTRVALLDRDFGRRIGGAPAVTRALLSRAARTSHWLLAKSLIVSCTLVEERLMLLFALLGERWGKVTPTGIRLDLPLTHRVLASLCGARRPSVTMALRTMQTENVLERITGGGWLLSRSLMSGEASRPPGWSEYANALGLAQIEAATAT